VNKQAVNDIENALNALKSDIIGQIGTEASKRIFSWEDAERDSTRDGRNK
jgi:hypothetical protein